jgi:septal ring factor EnvC (AmiA/AmiB activator)
MSDTNKDNIIKTEVKQFKGNKRLDEDKPKLFIYIDEDRGFSEKEEVVLLKCSEFPELHGVNTSTDLRRKIEEHSDNAKRVRELKNKLESAQESYNESLNVTKIKTDLEIKKLKEENKDLKTENRELSLRLKDVTRRINEINSLLNDL